MQEEQIDFQIFVKPAGARCNLKCGYCYYLDKEYISASSGLRVMPEEILEKYIIQHFKANKGLYSFFSWHGGEPLLAGIGFFRKVIELQQKYKPENGIVYNGIQTNGILLTDSWCRFLSEHNFYVGISIDGPEDLHNHFRTTTGNKPTFGKIMKGYGLLHRYNIMHEVLCVVSAVNVNQPLKVYRFLKSLGVQFITFLPLVIRNTSMPDKVDGMSVPAEAFGKFLCTIFDEWKEKDIGNIKIQIFEEALRQAFGEEHTLCIFKKICGRVPVIEVNGNFYSCDHYVDDEHMVGNINYIELSDMLNSEKQKSFGLAKLNTLPQYCVNCDVRDMCNGECPRNRFINTPDGEPGLNYLCPGYKMFFRHIKPFAEAVSAAWQSRNR